MSNDARTSPAPRTPTPDELRQLAEYLCSLGLTLEEALVTAECASIAVFDHYITDGPEYAGKLMSVVWSGSPTFFDVFTWKNGKLDRNGRDYDEKECNRCGSKNGTLCFNCWRRVRL